MAKRKVIPPQAGERNLTLQANFNQYILDHPEVLDQLPEKFRLVILPLDDPELSAYNLYMLRNWEKRDKPVVIVLMQASGMVTIKKIRPEVYLPLAAQPI